MNIIDISRELFSVPAYPGDPVPSKRIVKGFDKEKPDICQLTELTLGSHSGTHIDAPRHFIPGGLDVEHVGLRRAYGRCKVVETATPIELTADMVDEYTHDGTKRLLLKGGFEITPESAQRMVDDGIRTIGTEAPTVGGEGTGPIVHRILLGAEVLIIENLDLSRAKPGDYTLSALPLRMADLDGSPVRAVLIEE
ncbi:MAG: cyclase family protein [Eubacteriales bacterium]|jgi:arylformamidase|nr:cyclase family protein [Lachnospiraceae bacterium]MDD5860755.1 cyclase family protein [Eubacteriales bacterium]MCH4063097.1 cyclase family protein [Lachnospiraceae bacterium]MCH4104405.1 cyclase family protein [Lachnospiraceae bacterium]MCI1308378.1 cyclase family protein [Lachnospiraceae bacterium]